MGSIIININQNINDNEYDFTFLLRQWHKVRHLQNDHVHFNFEGCSFLQQNAVVFLGAMTRYALSKDNNVIFHLAGLGSATLTNLEQNGFLHEMGADRPPWNGNSIPYREDINFALDYGDYLADRWLGKGWLNIEPNLKSLITQTVIEAYLNVFDHAHSPIGVITCGQHYPNRRLLKLALVDLGYGIPTTVRNYLQDSSMSSSKALEWAFRQGNTTKDKTSGIARGNGLKILADFLRNNGGTLHIYSGNGSALVNKYQTRFDDRAIGFQGTFVQITLHTDVSYYKLPSLEDTDSQELFF